MRPIRGRGRGRGRGDAQSLGVSRMKQKNQHPCSSGEQKNQDGGGGRAQSCRVASSEAKNQDDGGCSTSEPKNKDGGVCGPRLTLKEHLKALKSMNRDVQRRAIDELTDNLIQSHLTKHGLDQMMDNWRNEVQRARGGTTPKNRKFKAIRQKGFIVHFIQMMEICSARNDQLRNPVDSYQFVEQEMEICEPIINLLFEEFKTMSCMKDWQVILDCNSKNYELFRDDKMLELHRYLRDFLSWEIGARPTLKKIPKAGNIANSNFRLSTYDGREIARKLLRKNNLTLEYTDAVNDDLNRR